MPVLLLPLAPMLGAVPLGVPLLPLPPCGVRRCPTTYHRLRVLFDSVCSRGFAGDIQPACGELVLLLAASRVSVASSVTIRVSDVFPAPTSLVALTAAMGHALHLLQRLHRVQLRLQRLQPAWAHAGVSRGWDFVLLAVSMPSCAADTPIASGFAALRRLLLPPEVSGHIRLARQEVSGRYGLLALRLRGGAHGADGGSDASQPPASAASHGGYHVGGTKVGPRLGRCEQRLGRRGLQRPRRQWRWQQRR
jgi:hypothetical protein